jgi:hypothetical protein
MSARIAKPRAASTKKIMPLAKLVLRHARLARRNAARAQLELIFGYCAPATIRVEPRVRRLLLAARRTMTGAADRMLQDRLTAIFLCVLPMSDNNAVIIGADALI